MKKKAFFILVLVLLLFIFILGSIIVLADDRCPHGVTICGIDYNCSQVSDGVCPESYGANCCADDCPILDPDCDKACCVDADCAATEFCNTSTHTCKTNDLDYSQAACEDGGFTYTGTYCCGEWDDGDNESYNDLDSANGACFKGELKQNDDYLTYQEFTYYDVFVFNGSFYGCGFDDSLFSPLSGQDPPSCVPDETGDCLQSMEDWPNPGFGGANRTREPLIKEADYCTILDTSFGSGEGVYCSYVSAWLGNIDGGTWNDTYGANLSHQSFVPEPLALAMVRSTGLALQTAHCCEPNDCWDPSFDNSVGACIGEQLNANAYYKVNENTIYKCLNGEWTTVDARGQRDRTGCYVGYCPGLGQCLYDWEGNPAHNDKTGPDPQCIADGQYIMDYLCDNGNWTTRTKKLALKLSSLIDYEEDDFVLMCGLPDEVLVHMQSLGTTNNYCILNYNGQRIIGTTLNQPLYDATTHIDFISALESSFWMSYPDSGINFEFTCDESADDFDNCVDNDYLKLYYDDEYKMVVFSDEDVGGLTPGFGQTICDALPFWLKWLCAGPSELEQDLEGLQLFNKVYAARLWDQYMSSKKEVFGVAEEVCEWEGNTRKTPWIYSFNYTGFSAVDLRYMIDNIVADEAYITSDQKHIFIKNPGKDAWTALTLLRNTQQE